MIDKPVDGYVRAPGLHMSDIYNAAYKQFDPKRYDKRDDNGDPLGFDFLKMVLGTAFETKLEEWLAEHYLGQRPGEFTTPEGIIYSPDYLFFEDGECILGEFKLTWYSTRGAPTDPKFDKWFTQMKLYCYHLGITRARLFVLFVNADYPREPKPTLMAWEIEFTPRELADEWSLIKRIAIKEGLLPSP